MTIDEEITNLMETMSAQQLRDLAFELYNRGEDIADIVELIHKKDMQERIRKEL